MKCRNCNHEIVQLSSILDANSKYAHLHKSRVVVMCEIENCFCAHAE